MNQGMIIIPGGGYGCVVIDKEGLEIARYFAGLGIACFVLAYRLPAEGHESGATVPLSDAQRAIRLVRSRAREWNLDSARIGVAGFSAGGHLAASLSTRYDEKTYPERDAPDAAGELRSARPDFTVLGYPVISMREGITHWGSRECLLGKEAPASAVWETSCDERVTPATPPSFLVHAQDDGAVPVENSLRYFQALERAGVSASELHIFPEGGHGFALRESERPAGIWPILAARWLSRF